MQSDLPAWIRPGARFRLIQMGDDPCPVEPGSTGVIDSRVLLGGKWSLNVTWDAHVRRSLSLVYPIDEIEPLDGGSP